MYMSVYFTAVWLMLPLKCWIKSLFGSRASNVSVVLAPTSLLPCESLSSSLIRKTLLWVIIADLQNLPPAEKKLFNPYMLCTRLLDTWLRLVTTYFWHSHTSYMYAVCVNVNTRTNWIPMVSKGSKKERKKKSSISVRVWRTKRKHPRSAHRENKPHIHNIHKINELLSLKSGGAVYSVT